MTEYIISHGYARNGKFVKGLHEDLVFTDRALAVKKFIELYDEGLKGNSRFKPKTKSKRTSVHFECNCKVYKDKKYDPLLTTNFIMQSLSIK